MSTDAQGERLSLVKTAKTTKTTPAAGNAGRRGARRRLGPGRPIPYGRALGPLLLLAVWSAGSAAGLIDTRNLSAPGRW
ncbi:hypothetical protein SVIO_104250 [Streptomyces violaceusniger]|uniref:ABC transporter permease n=1 Tax=Streptomyces violaceusniger TaxID=68280 RepID=A0A4D4LEY1_STRVO|nr:hypothetical protein SVIO_104250 [Streptomyces violaceusniger]